MLPPVAVGYVLLLLFGARGPIGGWLDRWFGVVLIFTRNGAALATAVMSFPSWFGPSVSRSRASTADSKTRHAPWARALGPVRERDLALDVAGAARGRDHRLLGRARRIRCGHYLRREYSGQTRTLPLALYSALQEPGGEHAAARLAVMSVALGLGGLLLSEWFARRVRRSFGR